MRKSSPRGSLQARLRTNTRSVNVREVRSHLARLLTEVSLGQSVAITKRGRVLAKLVPVEADAPLLPSRVAQRQAMVTHGAKAGKSTVERMRDDERA